MLHPTAPPARRARHRDPSVHARSPHRPVGPRVVAAIAALGVSVGASQVIVVSPSLSALAVAAHVLALVMAFGAVIVVDWFGLLWMMGRADLAAVTVASRAVDPLIWMGIAGLLASGALLAPDLHSLPTQVKLAAVGMLIVNGVLAGPLREHLAELPPRTRVGDLAPRLWTRVMLASAASQLGWWTAIVIGFLNDAHSHAPH